MAKTGDRKTLPHNDEAERAVLSALMMNQEAFDRISSIISASDFYHPANRVLYSAISDMKMMNTVAVDQLTLYDYLQKKNLSDKAGGASYLAELSDAYTIYSNIEYYAKLIKETSVRRALIQTSSNISNDAFNEGVDVFDLLESSERKLSEISINSNPNTAENYRVGNSLTDVINVMLEKLDGTYVSENVETGIDLLDKFTNGGFQKSDYIIVAARPSVGKTAFAVSLIRNMIRKSMRIAFFSLEMPGSQIITRLLSCTSRVELSKLFTGNLTQADIAHINSAAEKIYQSELYLVDEPNMKLSDLRSRARLLKREKDIDVLFIDYIGLIESGLDPQTPRHEQVGYVSKSIKQLARELRIPVVVLCQVSRDTADQEPQLNNLRDSGSIEQDADLVMFIHRKTNLTDLSDEDMAKLQTDSSGKQRVQSSKLLVAKNRNGKTGTIYVGYIGDITSFETIAQDKSLFIEPSKDAGAWKKN